MIPWRRGRPPTSVFLGFPCGSTGEESTCNVGDLDSVPWLGRSPGEGKGYPLQCPGLGSSMDCNSSRGSQSRTRLSRSFFLLPYRATLPPGVLSAVESLVGPRPHPSTQPLLLNSHSPTAQYHCLRQDSADAVPEKGHIAGPIQLLTSRALFGLCGEG